MLLKGTLKIDPDVHYLYGSSCKWLRKITAVCHSSTQMGSAWYSYSLTWKQRTPWDWEALHTHISENTLLLNECETFFSLDNTAVFGSGVSLLVAR